METIDRLPVVLDPAAAAAALRFEQSRAPHLDFAGIVRTAQSLIKPRAVFEVAYVGALGEAAVELGGVTFASALLRRQLGDVNKAFPFILTVGPELEREAAGRDDLLAQYYLEGLADIALEQAASRLGESLAARFGLPSLSALSPGSLPDWPITEQTKLFALLGDVEHRIGVRLTESLLMVPRKSISGILFPSEEGFVACQLCDRQRCPGRKAPFTAGA
jgi:Vitamin B12 dependent methionine synthase, activation domain